MKRTVIKVLGCKDRVGYLVGGFTSVSFDGGFWDVHYRGVLVMGSRHSFREVMKFARGVAALGLHGMISKGVPKLDDVSSSALYNLRREFMETHA